MCKRTFILLSWMPMYYQQRAEHLGMDVLKSGMFSVLPWITMGVFANVGGWLADLLIPQGHSGDACPQDQANGALPSPPAAFRLNGIHAHIQGPTGGRYPRQPLLLCISRSHVSEANSSKCSCPVPLACGCKVTGPAQRGSGGQVPVIASACVPVLWQNVLVLSRPLSA